MVQKSKEKYSEKSVNTLIVFININPYDIKGI